MVDVSLQIYVYVIQVITQVATTQNVNQYAVIVKMQIAQPQVSAPAKKDTKKQVKQTNVSQSVVYVKMEFVFPQKIVSAIMDILKMNQIFVSLYVKLLASIQYVLLQINAHVWKDLKEIWINYINVIQNVIIYAQTGIAFHQISVVVMKDTV